MGLSCNALSSEPLHSSILQQNKVLSFNYDVRSLRNNHQIMKHRI